SDQLSAVLNPAFVPTKPGVPVEMTVSVENKGSDTHSYTVSVLNLEPSWYNVVGSLRLFKGTSGNVRLRLQPPNQKGLPKAPYGFTVVVRADDGGEESLAATLKLEGRKEFQLKLEQRQVDGRGSGTFKVQLKNTGN